MLLYNRSEGNGKEVRLVTRRERKSRKQAQNTKLIILLTAVINLITALINLIRRLLE